MSLPVGSPTHSSRPEVANTYPAPFQAHRDEVHDSIYPSPHCADQRDRHTCPPPRHCTHPKPRIALQLTRALRTGAVEPWPTSQQGPAQVARRRPGIATWSVSDYRSRDKVAFSDVRPKSQFSARRTTCLWIKESERSSPNARGSQTSYLSTYRLPRVSVTFGKEEAKEVEHPSPNVRSWDSSNCWNFSST